MNTPRTSSHVGGSTLVATEPHAVGIDFSEDALIVRLEDGRTLSAPLEWFPRLRDASDADRRNWRLTGRGYGMHWPTLDEDISVAGLLGLPD